MMPLPIDDHLPAIVAGLRQCPSAVVVAEPGAGKSTRVAPAIAGAVNGQVLLLQPRRVAARAVAERIAQEHGSAVGGDFAGYRIRFENRTSTNTRIVVMTEGLLARRVQDDPFLEGVSCVILDEFHERSLHTDTAVALVREIQASVRPDLLLVIMSATMDAGPIQAYLGGCPVHTVSGRTFPLTVHHAPRVDNSALELRARDAIELAMESPGSAGHILVFLPGMAEIRRVADSLPARPGTTVHVLHSSVPAADQQAALAPSASRKIILSTNIAETSLTIDGIGCVVDSGLARTPVHDTRLGIDRLEVRRISKASARQRAGRAGRTGAGVCYRLYTIEEFNALADYDTPEIARLDLSALVLLLKVYGVPRLEDFAWFDTPPRLALERAVTLLGLLDAVDEDGRLTNDGRRMAKVPLHPRLAAVLMYGARRGLAEEAAWLCALQEAGDVTPTRPGHTGRESDVLDRLAEVRRRPDDAGWAVRNAARQLLRMAEVVVGGKGGAKLPATGAADGLLSRALLRGFPDRVVARRAPGDARGVMVGKRGTLLARESSVISAGLYIALDAREKPGSTETFITSASAIEQDWLQEVFPRLCRTEETIRFEGEKPVGVRQFLFADLVLWEKELGRLPQGMNAGRLVLAQLLDKHGSARSAVLQDEAAGQWLWRYLFLRAALPEEDLPAPDYHAVLEAACEGTTSPVAALKNLPALLQAVPARPDAYRLLADEAPEYMALPSGNRARIRYPQPPDDNGKADGAQYPAMAARVQELFGLAETPRLAKGRVPVTIELLSPARRPVQITRDLRSFWNGAYQEVRKELRARYPKHPWPEDPWTAPAVNIGGRRR